MIRRAVLAALLLVLGLHLAGLDATPLVRLALIGTVLGSYLNVISIFTRAFGREA
jgi:hypothetical protein